jgi:polar amino acid transport system permease protein
VLKGSDKAVTLNGSEMGGMIDSPAKAFGPARPEEIKAVPVRHWGRWISACVVIYLIVALIMSALKNPNFQWAVVGQYLFRSLTLRGLLLTIELTFLTMVVGAVGGVLLAVMRLSHNFVLSGVSWLYIWFFRGTPVYVQIILWANIGVLYHKFVLGLPLTGISFGSIDSGVLVSYIIVPAILALGLNEAAYAAELVRAGIISVDAGQTEAASSLGMSPALIMRRVVLPQAMRVIIPTFGNETIGMLKTTSLIAAIGGIELFGRMQNIYAQTFQIMPLIVVACLWYLFLTTILTVGQHYLEAYFGKGFGDKEAEAAEKRALRRAAKAHAA